MNLSLNVVEEVSPIARGKKSNNYGVDVVASIGVIHKNDRVVILKYFLIFMFQINIYLFKMRLSKSDVDTTIFIFFIFW